MRNIILFAITLSFLPYQSAEAVVRTGKVSNCIQCSGTFTCQDGSTVSTATYVTCDIPIFSQNPWSALGLVGLEGEALCARRGGTTPGGETLDCQTVNQNVAAVAGVSPRYYETY